MATVTVLLKENKANDKGQLPIHIRIIKNRKAKFISLGLKVHPDLWDKKKLTVKSGFPNSGRVNAFLAKKISEAEDVALSLVVRINLTVFC